MLQTISNNFSKIFDNIRGIKQIKEDDVKQVARKIRIALLEADVSLQAVKNFTEELEAKLVGQDVVKSTSAEETIIKIVNDELVKLLGGDEKTENFDIHIGSKTPFVIMMLGLQGSGKTTSSAKLAYYLKNSQRKKVLLASIDTTRPSAQEQLKILAQKAVVDCLEIVKNQDPKEITKRAIKTAEEGKYDVLIIDTAGRTSTDETLLKELEDIKKISNPKELLFVADSMSGQSVAQVARVFKDRIGITGVILTRFDSDSSGGAALSVKFVTECNIRYVGTGEKMIDFELFYPKRTASRILGMGDVVSLVEKAQTTVEKAQMDRITDRFKKGQFDLDDFLVQLQSLRKLGGLAGIIPFLPNVAGFKDKLMNNSMFNDGQIKIYQSLIQSMTLKERRDPYLITKQPSRKKRIMKGSGVTEFIHLNKLINNYDKMKKLVSNFGHMKPEKIAEVLSKNGGV